MLYLVSSILIVGFLVPSVVAAQEQGLGVSPSRISIEADVEWPYTVLLTVTNFSEEEEQFEVFGVSANPGRFSLGAKESRRVLVTFEGPGSGTVEVVSKRTSPEGFTTGTGMKIPFEVGKQDSVNFVAGVAWSSGWGSISQVFAGLMMLLAIGFLWYLANYVRRSYEI